MGKTFRRAQGDRWDEDDYDVHRVKKARKANKIKRQERHRADTIIELNDRYENDEEKRSTRSK